MNYMNYMCYMPVIGGPLSVVRGFVTGVMVFRSYRVYIIFKVDILFLVIVLL